MEVRGTGLALEERGSNRNRWKAPGGIRVKMPVKRRLASARVCAVMCAALYVDYDFTIRIAARQPFSSDPTMR